MPNFWPSALRFGLRSTPTIRFAPAIRAPWMTFRPMRPGRTRRRSRRLDLAVLITAPMPVVTPQPM